MTVSPSVHPILQIDGLNIDFVSPFSRVQAARNINLTIEQGSSLGLVGESGSGKSTLGFACLGLLPSTASITGNIRLNGQEVVAASPRTLAELRGRAAAMIFQNPMVSLSPFKTVGRQMTDIMRSRQPISLADAMAMSEHALKEVLLPDPASQLKKFPHQLSGGQLQRVMIAIAISCGPSLLIADEPTTALDVTVQAEILELLSKLRQDKRLSILFISHNLGVVSKLCDTLAVMKSGEIVEQGATQDIVKGPQNSYTQKLLSSVPRFGAQQTPQTPCADDMQDPLLTVEGLAVKFKTERGYFDAVKGIWFAVPKGGSMGLVGESGSGKSTIANAIAGLVRASGGRVQLGDEDLFRLRGKVRRKLAQRIGFVFQNPYSSLNPRMQVGEAVAEPIRVHRKLAGEALDEAVGDLFSQVQLDRSFMARYPATLSGGQRQRVAIARALALEPDLLLLDEPTAALDVTVQAQIVTLLQDLRSQKGIAYLFISHDLAVVEQLVDNVIVLRHGEVVEAGSVTDVFRAPSHPYTRSLIEAVPSLPRFDGE